MKKQFNQIASPQTVDSIAKKIRNHSTSFHRSIRDESIKLKDFKNFCDLCDATIIVRKSDGSEINFSE